MGYIRNSKLLFLGIISVYSCNTSLNNSKTIENSSKDMEITNEQLIPLLVGTYTGATSKGIYRFQFNSVTGELTNDELVAVTENPSYLSISGDGNTVFAVNETDSGSVSSFRWNENKTQLDLVDQQGSMGMHPCYVAINPKENLVAAANYSSGNIVLYKVNEQANFVSPPQFRQHKGSGPVKPNQDAPRAHFSIFSTHGDYLYVVDLGIDQVLMYPVNADGELGDGVVALQLDKGDGPRHLVFHPKKDLVFVVNELSSTVLAAQIDQKTGLMKRVDKQSTLPADYTDKSFCADIHISKDGQFLYASNRGHNSIAIFKVLEGGHLKMQGTENVQGEWPRNFTLSPNGKHLLVANQNSNNITVFDVDMETGLLHFTGQNVALERPVCLKF